ncbi:MAG: homoserine kinase [Pseudomonadales bacterium]|nr:homoserine kinase [Pseudomonadales bacterium]
MAAFTTFSESALERYLVMFDIGELVRFEPITSGIENSNYFVTLEVPGDEAEFVLTITEGLTFEDVPFFNELFRILERSGLPVPVPQKTLDGMSSTIFCGKPAWLFPRLPGRHPQSVTPEQCRTIGNALARLHEGAAATRYKRANPYDLDFLTRTFTEERSRLASDDAAMLERIFEPYKALGADELPAGIIHGDLFRDNALFEGEELTGIIDFYHACTDFLAQDVAITINDWCTAPEGQQVPEKVAALMEGYESIRPMTSPEKAALPTLMRAGALRFILTRLLSGEDGSTLKDPEEFLRIARVLDAEYHDK